MPDAQPPEPTADLSGAAAARAPEAEQPADTPPPPEPASSDPANEAPDPREARIAELRQQHADGTYEVDALEVSAKIIDQHLEK